MQVWLQDEAFEFRWVAANAQPGLGTAWTAALKKIKSDGSGDAAMGTSSAAAVIFEVGNGVYGMRIAANTLSTELGSDEQFYGSIQHNTSGEVVFVQKHSAKADDAEGVSAKIGAHDDAATADTVFGKIEKLSEEMGGDLTSALSSLQSAVIAQIDANEGKLDDIEGKVDIIDGNLDDVKAEVGVGRISGLVSSAASAATALTNIGTAQGTAATALASAVTALTAEIDGNEAKIDSAITKIEANGTAVGTVSSSLGGLQSKVGAHDDAATADTVFGKVQRVYEAVDQLEGFSDSVESNQASMASTLANLETKAQADSRQSNLVDEHDATQAAIGALNDLSEAQVNAQVDSALADYDAPKKSEMDAAFSTLESAQGTRQSALIAEHNATQATLADMETKAQADTRQSTLTGNQAGLATGIGDLATAVAAARTEIGDLDSDLGDVEGKIDAAVTDRSTKASAAASDRTAKADAAASDRTAKKNSLDSQLVAIKAVVDGLEAISESARVKISAPGVMVAQVAGTYYQPIVIRAIQQDGRLETLADLDGGHGSGACQMFFKAQLNGADFNARLYNQNGDGSYSALAAGSNGVDLCPAGQTSALEAQDYRRVSSGAGGTYMLWLKIEPGDSGTLFFEAAGWDDDPSGINQQVTAVEFPQLKSFVSEFGKQGFAL